MGLKWSDVNLDAGTVPERAVMGVIGWSNTAMAARYQHVTATIQRDIATCVGGLIWQRGKTSETKRQTPGAPEEGGPAFCLVKLAVAVGFEPTDACTSHAFEACSFGRSDTPPPRSLADRPVT